MTQSSDATALPNLSPQQQKDLQDQCRKLNAQVTQSKQTLEALMESNQLTTVSYDLVTKQGALEPETFVLYGITVSNQITQEAGTDFRIGRLDLDTMQLVWEPLEQNFDKFGRA